MEQAPKLISKSVATYGETLFVSEPLKNPREFTGLFSEQLDFTVNKMDTDLDSCSMSGHRNGPVLIGVHVDYSDNHKLFETVHAVVVDYDTA